MKYIANPVVVEAYKIEKVGAVLNNGQRLLELDKEPASDRFVYADAGMLARYVPKPGDYWVIQEDSYTYVNPAEVFERKYRPAKEGE